MGILKSHVRDIGIIGRIDPVGSIRNEFRQLTHRVILDRVIHLPRTAILRVYGYETSAGVATTTVRTVILVGRNGPPHESFPPVANNAHHVYHVLLLLAATPVEPGSLGKKLLYAVTIMDTRLNRNVASISVPSYTSQEGGRTNRLVI